MLNGITQPGGVVLDGWGGLHPFGGFALNGTSAPYWSGWDIARSVVVRGDGSGGWMLEGWGGIHPFGLVQGIAAPAYWRGWDIARALVITSRDQQGLPDGRQGYVLDGWGGLHPFGGAPAFTGNPYWPGWDIARGLDIHFDSAAVPDGGWVMLADGTVHAFGAAPALPDAPGAPTTPVWLQLHVMTGVAYAVPRWGVAAALTGGFSPAWDGYADWGSWDILRDIAVVSPQGGTGPQPVSAAAYAAFIDQSRPHGGVTLDGWGGLHPFGGFVLNGTGAPYWSHWDAARSLVVRADGSGGWILDSWGAIHPFGLVPAIQAPAYWPGCDCARALVVTSRDGRGMPDGRQGYVLDSWGGLHAFGGAPALTGNPYWQGWDIARGLDIHLNASGIPDGGVVLDGWGGIHPFGAADTPSAPAWWPSRDTYLALHEVDGKSYSVSRFGLATGLSPGIGPHWEGYFDWGGWDILRDVVFVGSANPVWTPQPMSPAASAAYRRALEVFTISAPVIRQGHALDCEAAALRVALAALGTSRTEDWILGLMGADLRRPVLDRFRNIIRWGNPYQTFVGYVDGSEVYDSGYGVYWPPITAAARAAGRTATGGAGWSAQDIYWQLALGHPVVIWTDASFVPVRMRWWTSWDGQPIPYAIGEHAVTLVGVDAVHGSVTLVDVQDGRLKAFTMARFESFWSSFGNMAVVVS